MIAIWPADLGKRVIILPLRHCLIQIPVELKPYAAPNSSETGAELKVEYLLCIYEALSNL